LSNAWQGYHCCLFAYGQTGAGKSYSMVGYGANKVSSAKLRELYQFHVNKYSIESQQTLIRTSNTRSMYRWWRFIMKKCRTYLSRLAKDQKKVTKSDSIKLWAFMSRAWASTSWILMRQLKRKWSRGVETGQSQLLKWMPHQVEPIL